LNFALLLLTGFGFLLLILLVWVLRGSGKSAKHSADLIAGEESGRRHATYFSPMRQAMAAEDTAFLTSRGFLKLSRRMRKERQRIALDYVSCLQEDFLKLWRLARVIASISPQVGIEQEFWRFRLGLTFYLRYELIRLKLLAGFAPLPELGSLSEVVSRLAMRLETTMNDLGERAALATRLASSPDGHGLDTP
jgi:hypothetical protein